MQKNMFKSLAFKIGVVILLVEMVVLGLLGTFYRTRFNAQIDQQVQSRVKLPGKLMSAGLLNYAVVANRKTMESLVGQSLADAAVVGLNQNIFTAIEPTAVGKNIRTIPGLNPDWFQKEQTSTVIAEVRENGKNYVISVTPLLGFDQKTPFLFAYVKINTDQAKAEKAGIARLFLGGSVLTMLLTSLAIIALFEFSIFRQIRGVITILKQVEDRDFQARVSGNLRTDEFGELQRVVNSMVEELEDLVETLEQRVKKRTAEIARQKYMLDTFIETVPDRIWFKDSQGRFTRSNKAHALTVGLHEPEDVIGKTDFDVFGEEGGRVRVKEEEEILRTGQPMLNKEVFGVLPDGTEHWMLVTKMPLRDETGATIGIFGISRDITELKLAQTALVQAHQEVITLNEQLQIENLRMGAELNVARRLQEMVLPASSELKQIEGLDVVGYMQPADEIGGDYYDVLRSESTVYIGIGDVTGHGLESGVLMLMTQTVIRTLIEHGETDPVKFVNTLNRTIYKNTRRMRADKTLTFALITYQNKYLNIVGQHEELLVVRKDGTIERTDTINLGFPIGLEQEIGHWVATATITLQPGDGIVLYTDGITEAENPNCGLYGLERLCQVIRQHWHASAEEIKQAVIEDVVQHIDTQKVYDDLTLLVLKQF